MTVAVRIRFDSKDVQYLFNKLPDELKTSVHSSALDWANYVKRELYFGAITDPIRPLTSAREQAAAKINVGSKSKQSIQINMPNSLIGLDSMKPHFIALKPGRAVTKWAINHYNGFRVGGKSRVLRTPKGGIQYAKGKKSALYVTPHPFIDKALLKTRNRLRNDLRKGVEKAIKKSRR